MHKSKSGNLIGLRENRTAELAQPRKRSNVTRPFSSRERVGSGYETSVARAEKTARQSDSRIKSHDVKNAINS